jgi:hypothetical protein
MHTNTVVGPHTKRRVHASRAEPSRSVATCDNQRMTRKDAAALMSSLLGIPVTPKNLARSGTPFLRLGKHAVYAAGDVLAHAERMLAEAAKGVGHRLR